VKDRRGSASQLANKNVLLLALLDHINMDRVATGTDGYYTEALQQLADLQGAKFAKARGQRCALSGAVPTGGLLMPSPSDAGAGGRWAAGQVALRARGILVESLLPSYSDRLTEMEKVLTTAVAPPSGKLKIGSPSSSDSDDESIPSFGRKKGTGQVFGAAPRAWVAPVANRLVCPPLGSSSYPGVPPTPPPAAPLLDQARLPDLAKLRRIVETNLTVDDVLTPFFYNSDPMVTLAALEVYIRRAYRAYDLRDVSHIALESPPLLVTEWRFQFPDHPVERTSNVLWHPVLGRCVALTRHRGVGWSRPSAGWWRTGRVGAAGAAHDARLLRVRRAVHALQAERERREPHGRDGRGQLDGAPADGVPPAAGALPLPQRARGPAERAERRGRGGHGCH